MKSLLIFLLFGCATLSATENLAQQVKEKLRVSEAEATNWIESLGTPVQVCELYNQAVRQLYFYEKGAKSLGIVGRAGIKFCLANDLKSHAKTIAYNLAVNSWPGWNEPGFTITAEDVAGGLAAAHLNMRLAIELEKPQDKVAMAHWLLSALQLASGDFVESVNSISSAIEISQATEDELVLSFYLGFRGMVRMAAGDQEGEEEFSQGIQRLKANGSEDAKFYNSQLVNAREVFSKK